MIDTLFGWKNLKLFLPFLADRKVCGKVCWTEGGGGNVGELFRGGICVLHKTTLPFPAKEMRLRQDGRPLRKQFGRMCENVSFRIFKKVVLLFSYTLRLVLWTGPKLC